MNRDSTQHLIKMANQIAVNSPGPDEARQCEFLLAHIRKFWAPSMVQQLAGCAGDERLQPAVERAARQLAETTLA